MVQVSGGINRFLNKTDGSGLLSATKRNLQCVVPCAITDSDALTFVGLLFHTRDVSKYRTGSVRNFANSSNTHGVSAAV
jgi:hypothetical protein